MLSIVKTPCRPMVAASGWLAATLGRNRSEQSWIMMPLHLVLQFWGGGAVVLSPSRLSSLAVSPSRLSPLALSPSRLSLFARSPSLFAGRYSSGFSERDVVLSALLSEFRGC